MGEVHLSEGHVYKSGNRIIPGVTRTIQNVFGSRPWYDEWYAQRGTAVHKAVSHLSETKLSWDDPRVIAWIEHLDPRITPRIKAFVKFIGETGLKIEDNEVKLFSRRYQFAGTADLILLDDKLNLILADIKSSIEPIVELQLAAYTLLWEETNKHKIKRACAVQLKDDGNYQLKWYKNLKRSQRIFLATLTVNNWKREHYPNH